jgi:hypothetical protein
MLPDSGKPDRESLSPEMREEIERRFDQAAGQTERFVAAFLNNLIRTAIAVIVIGVIAFSLDYVFLRRNANGFGSVTIQRFYAVTLKNKKTDFSYAEPEIQTCVNSVFPHFGYFPCWYVRRHNMKEIKI